MEPTKAQELARQAVQIENQIVSIGHEGDPATIAGLHYDLAVARQRLKTEVQVGMRLDWPRRSEPGTSVMIRDINQIRERDRRVARLIREAQVQA